jgi:hypothetical protein
MNKIPWRFERNNTQRKKKKIIKMDLLSYYIINQITLMIDSIIFSDYDQQG